MKLDSTPLVRQERICIWGSRCMFAGYLPDLTLRRRAAATVCIGLDEEFQLSLNDSDWMNFRSVLIPPMVDHSIRFSGGFCVLLFMDLSSPNYEFLRASNQEKENQGIFITLQEENQLFEKINQILATDSEESLVELLNQIPPLSDDESRVIDERIQKIVDLITSMPQEDHSAKDLAEIAGMSVSNLEHQFKKEVGIPFHSFRTWFRLKLTVYSLLHGMSHTDAAHRAGFFDSAHFTRTFRSTFGLPPSEIFRSTRQLKSFIEVPVSYTESW
ncbi:helix-turn-helix domain-containing protein [Leptospira sp. FAT2]|uniref:helix-turn-helix domain-containing protein n=1 Tax=Leptospira sanjuanensis TaxID=2879643 RepID=UPI001EE893A6|nr:AraC family transcriptional regulator [Leptospira sanjuanensis]MCG6167720.1 helix-turn-helix domain-containing protein [Leptospira sanjuanensis]MCG6193136.1 helix-turn-helix domain-containing protein [Leptospira sanjuanensis]